MDELVEKGMVDKDRVGVMDGATVDMYQLSVLRLVVGLKAISVGGGITN